MDFTTNFMKIFCFASHFCLLTFKNNKDRILSCYDSIFDAETKKYYFEKETHNLSGELQVSIFLIVCIFVGSHCGCRNISEANLTN